MKGDVLAEEVGLRRCRHDSASAAREAPLCRWGSCEQQCGSASSAKSGGHPHGSSTVCGRTGDFPRPSMKVWLLRTLSDGVRHTGQGQK